MIVLNMPVIEEAFQQVLGRLAPTVLQECIDEFAGTYPVLGTEEAFKNALTAKAPSEDAANHDSLFVRFEGALRLAQAEQKEEERQERERQEQRRKDAKTEDEKREAREEAERLKREVSAKTSEFRRVQGEVRDVNRDILAEAMDIRQLARDSDHARADPVVSALEALDEIAGRDGEVERLVKDSESIAKDIPLATRNGDITEIDGSIMAAESIRDHLRDILTVKMPAARTAVQSAITAAQNARNAEDAKAALQAVVAKAQADLDAIDGIDGIASQVDAAVHQYKIDVSRRTGTPPPADPADPDNPDKLTTAANNALAAAKAANDNVATAVTANDQTAAQNAATQVADERAKAQTALNTITQWSTNLNRAGEIEDVVTGHKTKQDEKEKAKKDGRVDQFLSSWKGHLAALGLFLAGIVLVFLWGPWWLQIIAGVAAPAALAVYGFSLMKGEKRKGAAVILGGFFVVMLGALIFLQLFNHADKGPLDGSSTPTPTATSSAKPVGDRPSQAELDAERTATAEASQTEAANP